MNVGAGKPDSKCKSTEAFPFVDGNKEREEEVDGESISLLASGCGLNGSLGSVKRQRRTRRKVQWNDLHGNNLVQVLEFQPSDSDEEDCTDYCLCTVM